MKHDVSREEFAHAVDEKVAHNSGPDMPALRARLDRLVLALPALKKGDDLSFTYLPGFGTTMRCQGRELKIEGKDFAAALFSIWLGAEPVNANLKRELLGRTGD